MSADPHGDQAGADPPEQEPEGSQASSRGRSAPWYRELAIIVISALVLSFLVRTFVAQAFFIPSGSMEQTLHGCPGCQDDRVLVDKVTYHFRDVRRGEIVVFNGTNSWPVQQAPVSGNPVARALHEAAVLVGLAPAGEEAFVKRVIAIPGDTVQCCDSLGRVEVNGTPLEEPYVFQDDHQPFGPEVLGPGQLWLMGDHRGDSSDSRAHGPVPEANVIGRAVLIVWPVSRWAKLGVPATFADIPPPKG